MSIYDDLPVDVEANDPGHPGIHNATNTAVKALDGRLTAVESSSADTDDALAAEVTARAAADTTLAAAIALKQDAATAATDTELAAEAAARAAADDALDARVDTLEGSVASGDTVARASIADHLADTVDAHDASAISCVPAGGLSATDVQAALAELDSEKQPLDSDLTAIAALTTTSFGRALLALVDAAAGRTALGLGTAATTASTAYDAAGAAAAAQAASQPLDSDLTAIAALTTTSFGRAFLALADAAAARTAVGLGNVDNTSDASKPVSTATQTALDLKAPLASPALTGTPTVPTAAVDTSTTQAASTAFVTGQAASATPVVNGTGAAGSSTRYARADHVHPTDTSRAALASPTFTGTPAAPTASARTGTTQLATTAYVDAADTTITANTQTGSYTLVLGDAGKTIEQNSASATVVTIPPNSSVAFPVGTVLEVCRIGAGSVTITPGSGVTIPNRLEAAGTTSRTLTSQYSAASLRKRATDAWVLVGDIS